MTQYLITTKHADADAIYPICLHYMCDHSTPPINYMYVFDVSNKCGKSFGRRRIH